MVVWGWLCCPMSHMNADGCHLVESARKKKNGDDIEPEQIDRFFCVWEGPAAEADALHFVEPNLGLFVWCLHALPMFTWVASGFSGFLTSSKDMYVWLIGDFRLLVGGTVGVCGCLSLVSPVMNF